jgi:glycosyltransferase involved in cell wall biosynthesis
MVEAKLPMVSVIIPCHNEVDFIENTVRSILGNDYPTELVEILVVDGMSDDGTRDIVERLVAEHPQVKLLDNPQQIVPLALNKGIRESRGDILILAGCHCKYSSDYISSCVEVLQRTGASYVGGYMETLPGNETLTAKSIALATSSRFGVGTKFRTGMNKEQEADAAPFGAFRKEIIDTVGTYHPLLVRNQDMEFCSRVRKAGFKIIISPKIKPIYYNRDTFQGLRRQAFANGLWNAYTLWIVGGGLRTRHFIPGGFVLGSILLAILGISVDSRAIRVFWIYLGLYLLTGILESFRIALRQKKLWLIPLISITFVQLHFCYGFGTLLGLIIGPFKFRKSQMKVEPQDAGR